MKGESSEAGAVITAIPQGTVLGPLLFVINIILENINSHILLFAESEDLAPTILVFFSVKVVMKNIFQNLKTDGPKIFGYLKNSKNS